MTAITKPILLDDTGKEIAKAIKGIENAIRGIDRVAEPWSITINPASSNSVLPAMGGDVASWYQYRAKIGRYLVNGTDRTAKKLSKTDSMLYEDGTQCNLTQGQVMVRLPRLYYKVTTSASDLITIEFCEREFADCNMIDEQWVGAYLGAMVGSNLVSRPNLIPTRSKTIEQFYSAARGNGTEWGLVNYEQRKMMLMLYLCEFLDLNSQHALGNGMTGTGNNWCSAVQNESTGRTSELGDSCGKVNFTMDGQSVGGACHVSLFGIEDPYGWIWEMVQGCYFGSSNNEGQDGTEMFVYNANAMPTAEELATQPSHTFRKLTRPTSSGWIKTLILGSNFDWMPAILGGSSTTYYGDYSYNNNTGQLLLVGGNAGYGSYCGLVFSDSYHAFSHSASFIGSRLAYYGEIHIVD